MRLSNKWVALAALITFTISGAAMAGSITGTVKFDGTPPKLRPLKMDADPGCAKKHSSAVMPEVLVLGSNQEMANIFVRITNAPGTHSAPSEAVVMDQKGCQYIPHVVGVMVGQKFLIKNSDGLLHNVHSLPKKNQGFNRAMPAAVTEAEYVFDKEEFMFKVKCDVHPWMNAWVGVMTHPYFDVTGTDGKFEIKNVPAGSYDLEIWHERLGTKTAKVTVGDGAANVDFAMSAPKKK